ncbi:MAG: protease pro-enzyme activation domain-containing protein [Solirubrobacteraceae bacterium]
MWGARAIAGLAVELAVGALVLGAAGASYASAGARAGADAGARPVRALLVRIGPAPAAEAPMIARRALDPATTLRVTLTLRPRNPAALAAYAAAVSTPGSSDYRRYLTPAQFARRFGATQRQIATVRETLRARGLAPGPASAGGLSIPVTATAARLERALSVSLSRLRLPGRHSAIVADARPAVPAGAASAIQAVVGLDTVSSPHPLLARSGGAVSGGLGATRSFGRRPAALPGDVAPSACPDAQQAASDQSAYTADRIASAYGFDGLYASGDGGAGATVAVYELESDDPADLAAYQDCYGTHAQITYVPVDGGAGSGPGTGEATLDIENLIGLAPDVNVLVYQGPNSNSGSPGAGPYDTFSAIINQDRAQVISVSWGQCEAQLGQADALAENTLFEQAAVQGESIVAASGDNGAEDCYTGGQQPDLHAAVDDPASQPLVTGVGGTSIQSLGPPLVQSTWNGGGSSSNGSSNQQAGASGGGVSSFWAMPGAQLDAPSWLGVRNSLAGGSECGHPGGLCREVPDVAADADPQSGYLIYWNGGGAVFGQPSGWQAIGGTSGGAPVWAALLALADASPACAGSPIGYADPALYRAAGAAYAADFDDVTSGNNDFTGTNNGLFTAAPGYDLVTGLGTPDATALAARLCAGGIRLANPGLQRSTLHARVTLRLHATDGAGAPVVFTRFGGAGASGLPRGLRLDPHTGRISGRLSHAGTYAVRITAQDAAGATAGTAFEWMVGGAPRVNAHLSATAAAGAPQLALTVRSARGAPPLQSLTITVPRTLRLRAHAGGISVSAAAPGRGRVRFTAAGSRRTMLRIMLRASTGAVRVLLRSPALTEAGGRVPAGRVPATVGRGRLGIGLAITDATGGVVELRRRL